MFDLTRLIISPAFAQDAGSAVAAPSQSPSDTPMLLVFLALFAVWFFVVIRPQQKKLDEQNKMIKSLQRGDRIVTSGGIHGKIAKLEGDTQLIVEIAEGVQIKVDRTSVQGLEAKTEPVAASVEDGKK